MALILTIVRHGNTFAADETPRRIGRRSDVPLTPAGEAQAQRLGLTFAAEGLKFDQILTSPLQRTRQSAAAIAATMRNTPAPQPEDWLAEIDHGPDEGHVEEIVKSRVGADALLRWDRRGAAPDGWVVDAPMRLDRWRTLLKEATGEILVVTSNGAARFALLTDPRLAEQAAALPSLKLRTGAYGRISVDQNGPRVVAWDVRP